MMQSHYGCCDCNRREEKVKVTKCHYGCCVYREQYPTYMVVNNHHESTDKEDDIYVINKRYRVPMMGVPRRPQVVDLNREPLCRN